MPIMVIPCEQCGKDNRSISIKYPNPDIKWCDKCRQQIGFSALEHYFCSWDCLIEWIENYRSSNQKMSNK